MRLRGRHYETGEPVEVTVEGRTIAAVGPAPDETAQADGVLGDDGLWLAPGLFDSQVNGFGGRDLNAPDTTPEDVAAVVRLMWEGGVTRLCPTVTTQSFPRMAASLAAIREACAADPRVAGAAVTFHIEGPYISPEDGPRGAHPLAHTRPPDLDEFRRLQDAAGGRIGYVTLAPELPGALPFTERLAAEGVVVSLGHHAAPPETIRDAVAAGARHCTHLGNGAHATLPRHPNYIWEQLAADRLSAGIIADGQHLPAAVVKAFLRAKGPDRTVLVSDVIAVGGLPAGRYTRGEGQEIEITPAGRIQVAGTPYLAGAGLRLDGGVANAARFAEVPLGTAVHLATRNPARVFGIAGTYGALAPGYDADLLLFRWREPAPGEPAPGEPATLEVVATVARGEVVYRETPSERVSAA